MSSNKGLFEAARVNDAKQVAYYVGQGALVSSRGISGLTPLHICGVNDSHFAAAELLRLGASPATQDDKKRSALHVAALSQGYKVISLLIQAGADVDARDEEMKTPLSTLAWNGGAEGISMLLKAGADPDALDFKNRNPLLLAMKAGHRNMEALAELIRAGADPRIKSDEDESAMDLAELTQNHEALGLFYGSRAINLDFSSLKYGHSPLKSSESGSAPFKKDEPILSSSTPPLSNQLELRRQTMAAARQAAPVNVKRRFIPR